MKNETIYYHKFLHQYLCNNIAVAAFTVSEPNIFPLLAVAAFAVLVTVLEPNGALFLMFVFYIFVLFTCASTTISICFRVYLIKHPTYIIFLIWRQWPVEWYG